jgi:SNF2 family DNA or RNA helicase
MSTSATLGGIVATVPAPIQATAPASGQARPGIPQYLERPRPGVETFGTLNYVKWKGEQFWEIHGDPQAVVMAKRIFPGSDGRGPGVAKFPATTRAFADLVWFLMRWPMQIENLDQWERDYHAACEQVIRRTELNLNPVRTLPAPEFKGQLRPFQEEGHSWLLTNRRTLLADEMGLGKTPTALAFLATAREWPAVVVAPPHLVTHWEKKTAQFLSVEDEPDMPLFQEASGREKLVVHTIKGMKPYPLPQAHIYIIHYLLLRAWRDALKALGMPTVIFDEVQELRHSGTEKYSAASDISVLAANVIGLSGTPIYNYGAEIWNVMNVVDYHCLGDFDSFSKEWCYGYGQKIVSDPIRLGQHLRREGLMIRRRKDEVLDDLPPKRRVVQSIDGDSVLFKDLVKAAVKLAKDAEKESDVFTRGRMERDAMDAARQATGIAKAPSIAAFVRGVLEAGEPTLLFAYHHAVVDELKERLKEFKPVFITGRETKEQKAASVEAFRSGETSLCIISLRAATGLDELQERARVVVFGELDWSPAVHSQAEDRAHRMGQKDSVLAYYLVTEVGMDPDMLEALGLKVRQFVGLMGDKAESEEDRVLATNATQSHMKRVLEKLRAMPGAA